MRLIGDAGKGARVITTGLPSSFRIRLNRPARWNNPASSPALPSIGTSPNFLAPRGGHGQALERLRNDRGKMATHIVPLCPALDNSGGVSRQTYVTLFSRKTAKNC